MHRCVFEAEMDILWQRYGVEYKVVGSAVHPSKMPLLVEPVAEHRFMKRFPPSFSSDGETEEAGENQRVPEDYSSLTEFDCSLFDQSSTSAPEPRNSPVIAEGTRSREEQLENSSTATPETIFECFSSAPNPHH